jgi:hypothetical protein
VSTSLQDEPSADTFFSFDFEKEDLTKERLQELIFEECVAFHPEQEEVEAAKPHGYRMSK